MSQTQTKTDIAALVADSYGFLFEEALIREIASVGRLKRLQEGEVMMDFGDAIQFMPLLIEGAVKVLRQDKQGDELLIYFLERGDTCAMTMHCCMGQAKSEVRAVAEKDSEIVLLPIQKMQDWLQRYGSWRTFVFESYSSRFKEMLESIESLAFMNMHERVQRHLREKAVVNHSHILHVTHQEIAYDLHSSRVVISRILKSLERDGKIKLHRNRIEVLDF